MRKAALFLASLAVFAGCVTPRVDPDDPGRVSGKLMVFWVGEDDFVYFPYYADPLTYELPKRIAERLDSKAIRPGAIYTDGGSIPRAVRSVVGFSPWGYGPAYIVHDWLFVAHHCIVHDLVESLDERDHKEAETVRNVDFPLSADILAGVIQALEMQEKVPERALAPEAIYGAVDSAIARRIWDNPNPKSCDPVDPKTIAEIERAIGLGVMRAEAAEPGAPPPTLVFQQDF